PGPGLAFHAIRPVLRRRRHLLGLRHGPGADAADAVPLRLVRVHHRPPPRRDGEADLVTSLVLSYFYICEVFTAWYSGEHFERASVFAKATKEYAWAYWGMYFCNCLVPLVLLSRKARVNTVILYVVSIFVLIGMWLRP